MIYPRLKLARDLLTDDGVIFISIDDNEVDNLRKLCNEIFGESNFVGAHIRKTVSQRAMAKNYNTQHEYCVIFAKDISKFDLCGDLKDLNVYSNPDNDVNGNWKSTDPTMSGSKNTFKIVNPYTNKEDVPPKGRGWGFTEEKMQELLENGRLVFKKEHRDIERGFILKKYESELKSNNLLLNSLDVCDNCYMNQVSTKEMLEIFEEKMFDYAKPVSFLRKIISYDKSNNAFILDFFSGSATTAHAVMQLNAEDGGNRKFIMVQLPELTDEKSEAYKAGYKNICEIGKERIRRAGQKIKQETQKDIDYGFRCLKLDESCMKDVYYSPSEYVDNKQGFLDNFENNIKEDRTAEDLLFQVMLDMGVLLSSEIKVIEIKGKKVFNVNDGNLVCCFEDALTDEVVTEIAKMKPLYAVFRDSSMANDSVAVNFDQIFETYSPNTTRKVL